VVFDWVFFPTYNASSCRRPQEVALDYIGKRGSIIGATRDARIQYARELLQKELLPHIGMAEFCETKKVGKGGMEVGAACAWVWVAAHSALSL
jgi:hypothetical protein